MVHLALWALRIYLLVLLSLMGLKFARVFSGFHKQDGSTTRAQAVQTNSPSTAASQSSTCEAGGIVSKKDAGGHSCGTAATPCPP